MGILRLNHIDILLIRSALEPSAWTRKYFTVASVSCAFFECIKIGINLSRLSSRAAQMKSQLVLDIAMTDLVIIMDVHEIRKGVIIKTWGS